MPETLKRALEVTVPAAEVDAAIAGAVAGIQKKVRLPGFRPGKAPAQVILRRFAVEVQEDVVRAVVGPHLVKRAEEEGLVVASTPDVTVTHFQPGEPLRFKAEFEVAPTFELKQYKGLTVSYQDPEVSDADLEQRLAEIREQHAQYVSVEPRPLEDGDYAVVALESLEGLTGPPIRRDELMLAIGDPDSVADFSDNLRGLTPPAEKVFLVQYPEEYGEERLAGKRVRFRARLKGIRRKELPELNDEFARDLGDFQSLEQLREAVRRGLFFERQAVAQRAAKDALMDQLVDLHEFPVPEAYLERQLEAFVRSSLAQLAAEGRDIEKVRVDWDRVRETQRERAVREVKASLLLGRIADAEGIIATNDEVDREVQRLARQEREQAPVLKARLEKEGGLGRLAARIRTEKTLNLLFEHARKTATA